MIPFFLGEAKHHPKKGLNLNYNSLVKNVMFQPRYGIVNQDVLPFALGSNSQILRVKISPLLATVYWHKFLMRLQLLKKRFSLSFGSLNYR